MTASLRLVNKHTIEFIVHATDKTSSSLVGSFVLFPFVTEQRGGDYKSCTFAGTWKLFRSLDIFQDRF